MLENLLQEAAQARSAGDNKQAALIYEQVTKICEKDPNQADSLAVSLQALAAIYSQEGLYVQVIPVYKKLIVLGSKVLGENHPDVINTAVHLARALEANKQFTQADEIFKLAAGKAERALGLSHPLAEEIRQEYFNLLANREGVEEDTLKLGLVPLPASKSPPISQSQIETSGQTQLPSIQPPAKAASPISPPPSPPPAKAAPSVPVKKSAKGPKNIKNLRYGAESAQEEAGNLLNIHVLRHRWRSIFYVGSVIVGIAAITIALSRLLVPVHVSAANLIGEQLIVKGLFQSADNISGVQFIDNRFAMLTADVQHRKIPYFLLKGSFSDIWAAFLSTVVTRETWFQFKGDELMSEDGNVFYSAGSPEFVVAKKMGVFAEAASKYYNAHGCYPDKSDKLSSEPGLVYINPFSSKTELPSIKRVNGSFGRDTIFPGLKTDTSAKDCFAYLRRGGSWREDSPPGKISALALYSSQRCADGYKVNEFYVHGYDRHGHLLTSGKPHTYYVFGLYGGKYLSDESNERMQEIERESVHPPRRIYIVPGDSTDLQFIHQVGTNLLTSAVIITGGAWGFFGLLRRLKNPDIPIQLIDVIFGFVLFIWAISAFIHLMG